MFAVMTYANVRLGKWLAIVCNTALILTFLRRHHQARLPLSSLPVVGKYFKPKSH